MTLGEAIGAGLGALMIIVVVWNVARGGRPTPHNDAPSENTAAVGVDGG